MDRRFKERLIGAVVLAAAAVLILPAVLNGPHAPLPEPAEPGDTAMRTETIELTPESRFAEPAPGPAASSRRSPATGDAAAPATADSTPAPADGRDRPASDATPAGTTAGAQPEEQRELASAGATSVTVPKEQPTPPAAKASAARSPPEQAQRAASAGSLPTAPANPAAPPAATAGEGWAVQVGTFASSSNATALAASLKARGYAAFVAPLSSADKTLYRVRVGPAPDIETARAIEQRLEKEGQTGDVVRQP